MPGFSSSSLKKLETIHPALQRVLRRAIWGRDFTVVHGARGREEQDELHRKGASQLAWPHSKHNIQDGERYARAFDIGPYFPGVGIPWDDDEAFIYLAGWIMACAKEEGVPLVWGGDWDGDGTSKDTKFRDLGHFELHDEWEEANMADVNVSIPEAKDGRKTSEFWVALGTAMFTVINSAFGLGVPMEAVEFVTEIAMSYILGRSGFKGVAVLKGKIK